MNDERPPLIDPGEAHPSLVDLAEAFSASAANAVRNCLKHHGQTLIPLCDIGINAQVTRHQRPLRVGRTLYGGGIMDTMRLSPLRQELLEILKERGYRRLDQPIRLASGALSQDFIDGKEALAEWRHLRLACEAIVETVAADGHRFDAVGGLTMGADALAVGIASVADCRWFFVRKEAKQRGTRRWVEGAQIGPGDTVLLVDDVVTTGGSIFKALDIVDQTGAATVAAVTLVDRSGLAGPRFEQRGVGYFPMITYDLLGIDRVEPVAAAS